MNTCPSFAVHFCVRPSYLAVTVSACLVTVGVKALFCVTLAWPTGRRPPPTSGTLVVNSTYTNNRVRNQCVESPHREKKDNRVTQTLICLLKESHFLGSLINNRYKTREIVRNGEMKEAEKLCREKQNVWKNVDRH